MTAERSTPRIGSYASGVDLLLIGDGSRYIDLTKAKMTALAGATYYRSERGAWVRKRPDERFGQPVDESEAFRAFMNEGKFTEAEQYFPQLFAGAAMAPAGTASPGSRTTATRSLRFILGLVLAVALVAYVVAIVTDTVPPAQRVSVADLAVVLVVVALVALLIWPQALDRIQIFEVGGIKVQVRELEHQLDEVRFVLRMLVTDHERDHLLNLESNHTSKYQLSDGLQAELRRLRAADLIRSKRYIHDMPGDGASFDLSEFVELTDRGRDYLRRMREPLAR